MVLSALADSRLGVDDTYFSMYESLLQEDLTGKLVLLQPPMNPTPLVRQMAVRNIRFEGLFSEERICPIPVRRPGPGPLGISETNLHPHVITNGGLISPQSETQGSISPPPAHRTPEGFKHIDPSKVSCSILLLGQHRLNSGIISRCINVSFRYYVAVASNNHSQCREPSAMQRTLPHDLFQGSKDPIYVAAVW